VAKPVRLRERAATDLTDAGDRYREQVGEQTALEFIDAGERGIGRIGRNRQIGSLHVAYELTIQGLRAWALHRFPYVVFHVDVPDIIDVWRVLHARRDIQATLQPPAS
jgi:toxin ParE1/3/4